MSDADWVEDVKRWYLASTEAARPADGGEVANSRERLHRLRGGASGAAGAPLAGRAAVRRVPALTDPPPSAAAFLLTTDR